MSRHVVLCHQSDLQWKLAYGHGNIIIKLGILLGGKCWWTGSHIQFSSTYMEFPQSQAVCLFVNNIYWGFLEKMHSVDLVSIFDSYIVYCDIYWDELLWSSRVARVIRAGRVVKRCAVTSCLSCWNKAVKCKHLQSHSLPSDTI